MHDGVGRVGGLLFWIGQREQRDDRDEGRSGRNKPAASLVLLSLAQGVDDGMAGGGVGAKGEDGGHRPGRLPRAPRPDLCRRFARRQLAQGLPGILQRFIDEAQKGSIPHAKALMSLAGLDKEEPLAAAHRKKPKGLSEMLLRELRRRPAAVAGTEAKTQTKRGVEAREDRDEGSGGGGDSAERTTGE